VPGFFLLALAGFAFVSLSQAELVDVGVYRFLKLVEFVFLFFYVATRVQHLGIKLALWAFIGSGVFQSILAVLQFARQSSLGLEICHESTLELGMKGVAQINAHGVDMIRAYGTFPSPNVLAGFLGLCLIFVFYLWVERENGAKRHAELLLKGTLAAAVFILSFGFLLTFSRGTVIFFTLAAIVFFAGLFLLKGFEFHRKTAIRLLLIVVSCELLVVTLAWPEVSSRFLDSSIDEPAIQERFFFNEVGLNTMSHDYSHMLFGIGMGNFVNNFMHSMPGLPDYLYQPVHNIFILIASETGTLGLFAFILFIAILIDRAVKNFFSGSIQNFNDRGNFVYIYTLLCVAIFMMLISMYDHYFWTLQQGSLLFWIVLGLVAAAKGEYKV